ncbi:pyridoxal phosphate-dependent transferase [Myxozyma melibiosi]|uniref:Pyridoxal phosphate-dependent transferase n=1 Tax=Myxozyma melibiosi TaxID=54550 RepID=A0ABR1FA85_9ASCO
MDPEEYRKAGYAAIDYIIDYFKTMDERKVVADVEPGYLRKLLPTEMPAEPEKFDDVHRDFESKIVPGLTNWQSPNFLAFFPSNVSYPSMLGELYSSAFSAPGFNWICSPAMTELETIVLDWLAKQMALPKCFLSDGEGMGIIQGSASESVITCMVAARDRYLRDAVAAKYETEEEKEEAIASARGKLVAFASDQTHSSTQKAALIAGVRYIAIPTSAEEEYALTGARLEAALAEAEAKGLMPFFLTASMGTTAVVAIDRFGEIAEVTKSRPQLWKHIDAAYAGAALVCPEHQHMLDGVEDNYDSFDMNMHKWLLVNFDASCMYVRRRRDLADALSVMPPYLRNSVSDQGLVVDFRDYQLPLGRRFRALKVWFVMRTYGSSGLQEHIRRTSKIGELFTERVRARADLFAIVAKPRLGLTVFQVVAPGSSAGTEATNAVSKKVAARIEKEGQLYLTSSTVHGAFAMRVVTGSPWATEGAMEEAYAYIEKVAEEERSE